MTHGEKNSFCVKYSFRKVKLTLFFRPFSFTDARGALFCEEDVLWCRKWAADRWWYFCPSVVVDSDIIRGSVGAEALSSCLHDSCPVSVWLVLWVGRYTNICLCFWLISEWGIICSWLSALPASVICMVFRLRLVWLVGGIAKLF